MNKDYIIFNLKEAKEELENLIQDFENDLIDEIYFETRIAHCYHHINHAFNGRMGGYDEMKEKYVEWNRFPQGVLK